MADTTQPPSAADTLLRANVARVFNERDADRRMAALRELWADDPTMFEADAAMQGRQAISDAIGALHEHLPSGTSFRRRSAAIVNHDAAVLHWEAVGGTGAVVATGTDLAFIKDGRIRTFYVFLDPQQR